MSRRWRVGGHWGRTIVIEGAGPALDDGRRVGDRLVGLMDTSALADLVVEAVNYFVRYGEVKAP